MPPKTSLARKKIYNAEQIAAAIEIDLDPERDVSLMKLVRDMCRSESLPRKWSATFDLRNSRREYKNAETGEKRLEHPLIGYYRGAVFFERGGYEQLSQRDEEHPPQIEEITAMAEYLGIKETEDRRVLDVARMAVNAPLPPDWDEIANPDGTVSYRSISTGEVLHYHPLDCYFIELCNRRRRELLKTQKRAFLLRNLDKDSASYSTPSALQNLPRQRPRPSSEKRPMNVQSSAGTPDRTPERELDTTTTRDSDSNQLPPPVPDQIMERATVDGPLSRPAVSFMLQTSETDEKGPGAPHWKLTGTTLEYSGVEMTPLPDGMSGSPEENQALSEINFDAILPTSDAWNERICEELDEWIADSLERNRQQENMHASSLAVVSLTDSFDASSRLPVMAEHILLTMTDLSMTLKTLMIGNDGLYDPIRHLGTCQVDVQDSDPQGVELATPEALQTKLREIENHVLERGNDYIRISFLVFTLPHESKQLFSICMMELVGTGNRTAIDPLSLQNCHEIALFQFLFIAQHGKCQEVETRTESKEWSIQQACSRLDIGQMTRMIFSCGEAVNNARSLQRVDWLRSLKHYLAETESLSQKTAPETGSIHRMKIEILRASVRSIQRREAYYESQYHSYKMELREITTKLSTSMNDGRPSEVEGADMNGQSLLESASEIVGHWIALHADRERDLVTLRAEIVDLTSRIDVLSTENSELRSTVTTCTHGAKRSEDAELELHSLQNELEAARESVTDKTEKLTSLQAEIDRLQERYQERATLTDQTEELHQTISQLTKEREHFQKEEIRSKEALADQTAKHEMLQAQICKLEQDAAEQEVRKADLQKRLDACLNPAVSQGMDSHFLHTRIEELREELKSASADREQAQREIISARESVSQLTAVVDKLQKENEKLMRKIEQLETDIDRGIHPDVDPQEALDQKQQKQESDASHFQSRQEQLDHISRLERDKALLLDRLEEITGEPVVDIHVDTPPGHPASQVKKGKGKTSESFTAEQALRSIGRIVQPGGYSAGSSEGRMIPRQPIAKQIRKKRDNNRPEKPSDVISRVRELKAERDDMRRRDRLLRDENGTLKRQLKDTSAAANHSLQVELLKLSEKLEQLTGIPMPQHLSILKRLQVGINGVTLMQDEILSLERQHGSLSVLLENEEKRSREKDRKLEKAFGKKTEEPAGDTVSQVQDESGDVADCLNTTEMELGSLRNELKQYTSVSGDRSLDIIGSAALRFARIKECALLSMEKEMEKLEKERNKWQRLCQQKSPRSSKKELRNDLFTSKSAPEALWRQTVHDSKSSVSLQRGKPSLSASYSSRTGSRIPVPRNRSEATSTASRNGGFDSRPVPAELQARFHRAQDQLLRADSSGKMEDEEKRDALDSFLTGDARDAEISSLKIRLVRAEKERGELVSQALHEKRESQSRLLQATRLLEQTHQLTKQLEEVFAGTLPNKRDLEDIVIYASMTFGSFSSRLEKLTIE